MKRVHITELKDIIHVIFELGPSKRVAFNRIEEFVNRTYMSELDHETNAKVIQLENILKARLPDIKRWRKVEVIQGSDEFSIIWSMPKNRNIHPVEIKDVPLPDIDKLIKRNTERLYSNTKEYK